MNEILKSTLLDFDKSFFYINFIKHSSGEKYISIEQTFAGNYKKQKVTLRISDLHELISVLENYKSENFTPDPFDARKYFSKEQLQSIVNIYFKGVPVKEIALQFDCSEEMIKKVLIDKNIEITDDKESRKAEMIRLSKLKY
jgi:hypothetical protein